MLFILNTYFVQISYIPLEKITYLICKAGMPEITLITLHRSVKRLHFKISTRKLTLKFSVVVTLVVCNVYAELFISLNSTG